MKKNVKKYVVGTLISLFVLAIASGGVALAFGGWGFGSVENKAEILGMTTEELKAALEDKTYPELLDEKGITHQQLFNFGKNKMLEDKAEIVGMTVEELEEALETKSFAEILDEAGISHTKLQEARQAEMKERATERLQSMVDEGVITHEEMQERLEQIGTGEGFGFGCDMGMGMKGGFHRGLY